MKVAILTLTRDRLEYTKRSFASLKEKAGHPFSHFVFDNGSDDDTCNWLQWHYKPHWLRLSKENIGIARAANIALNTIFAEGDWDLVIKMDNDCEVVTDNILEQLSDVFKEIRKQGREMVLSPRVEGLREQPERSGYEDIAGSRVGRTNIIGGLFHVVRGSDYKRFRYNEETPRGKFNDFYFCNWAHRNNLELGYVEDLVVWHMDSTEAQNKAYPEYFKRKEAELQEDEKAGMGKRYA